MWGRSHLPSPPTLPEEASGGPKCIMGLKIQKFKRQPSRGPFCLRHQRERITLTSPTLLAYSLPEEGLFEDRNVATGLVDILVYCFLQNSYYNFL